jgi:hypothetical protein
MVGSVRLEVNEATGEPEQNCAMREGVELQVVDKEGVVKSRERKVRHKWCRNGAEAQGGRGAGGAWSVWSVSSVERGAWGVVEGWLANG